MQRIPSSIRILALLLVPALLVPFFPQIVYPVFVMKVLCFALFALAFNLLTGFTGLVSFGHAAFFGWAGYAAGEMMILFGARGLPPEIAMACGVAMAAAIGYAIGWLAIRRTGIYFAMITLALSQVAYFMAVQVGWTRGEDGMQGIPRGKFLGLVDLSVDTNMYYFALAVFVLGFLFVYRVIHSPFGQVLKTIRDNAPRAISLGYDTDRCKLLAFVLSASVAGLAGSLKALVLQLVALNDVSLATSTEVLLMTLLGGIGTVWGPVVGATLVVSLQNYLATLGDVVTIVIGLIFVLCVSFFRRGFVGEWLAYAQWRKTKENNS
ncbi:branched-chain amino acid ABC transporter permease [Achromobacter insolitus]|uniref:Branched-chain amino acid ABC transporter permease n=1 Tax=Achromobacter insolitus TaxID=217204 RepID=A0A6S7FF68_9BURK|nr:MULTISPECIES: branched-chain amino acid ABC transporter permease [Achromobacter]GLK98208.1 branched-chain amino acid ABC transporter permease [Achromobacter xylosoxidans]APX77247.1 branched-chain amino acid ABC transporter permease [Achromobacter insolitus]MCP1405664.1 branched-chain amino acid transport system permease protein [Achromobacter insolitus]MEB3099333.1 branched-chain amino acid ABC transporter permease [Achromobacter sp. D10]OWT55041.1 branched-chain amino acid ABC transporter 